jgi:hypothetical protein
MNEADDEALEALRQALVLETPTHKLACWHAPLRVPGLGWVAEVKLFSTATYRGTAADVVLAPAHASVEDARDEALAAAMRIVELGLDVAIALPLGEALQLRTLDASDEDTLETLTTLDVIGRRRKALARVRGCFAAVEQRFAAVYGLRLPRSLIAWAALLDSLGPFEARALEWLGRSGGGIMVWFEAGGLDRQPCELPDSGERADPRLDCRFRRDPAELVTIAWGDSDGLHYGLWFDDPAEPASTIVANYARDSAETWDTGARDMLALLRGQLAECERDEAPSVALALLERAIAWFEREAADELAADPPSRWRDVARPEIIGSASSLGPALLPEHGDPRASEASRRYEAYRSESAEVDAWIAAATRELELGQPAFALVLGRELHWFDDDRWREPGLALLVAAYRALGRDALAEIALVHHRHRDLRSVAIF